MNLSSLNLKLIIAFVYISILAVGLFFLFSAIDIKDLMSYEFIRLNKDINLKYKNEKILFLTIVLFYILYHLGAPPRLCDAAFNICRFCFWKMVGKFNSSNRHFDWSNSAVLIGWIFFSRNN